MELSESVYWFAGNDGNDGNDGTEAVGKVRRMDGDELVAEEKQAVPAAR